MFFHAETNTYIREGTAFTINGEQFGAGWLNAATKEQKAAKGIVECTYEGLPQDDRYYFNTIEYDNGVVRTVSTRKPQEMIDGFMHSVAVEAAQRYLQETDWYVTRKAETGKEIPAEVTEKRTSARTLLSSE